MSADNTELRSIDETARREFELALREETSDDLAQFLPPADDPRFLATLEELVQIDMEWKWKRFRSGESAAASPPVVEHFVSRFPQLDDSLALMRLLRSEYELRHRYGDRPSSTDYQQRFPEVIKKPDDVESKVDTLSAPGLSTGRHFSEGRKVGRYQLSTAHATGGFGVVWRAHDDQLGRQVALKHLRDRVASNDTARTRFLHEARITARLEHPGIVPVYEIGGEDGAAPFYTMKFVRGQTLDEAIGSLRKMKGAGNDSVGMLRLLNVFLAVARTMQYSHSQGVVHRDLKPQNVVVGEFGETIILDWGLARASNTSEAASERQELASVHNTIAGTVQGTPAYMSPEQAAGQTDQIDERSDVYSLGAILYQVLTGSLPFLGKSANEILKKVQTESPRRPRHIDRELPRALEAICLKALAREKEDRYEDVRALVDDMERYLADEKTEAWQEPWYARVARWRRRHRTLVTGLSAAAGVLLISLGVGVALLTAGNRRERELRTVADQRRVEAMDNFRLARRAVDSYLNRISVDDRLSDGPLEPLRRDLLSSAREFYQQLVQKQPKDDQLRLDQAEAHARLAMINRELGQLDASIRSSRIAIAMFEDLCQRQPDNSAIHDRLGNTHAELGITHRQAGFFEDAAEEYEAAIAISRKLVEQNPNDVDLEMALVLTLTNFGGMSLGRPATNPDGAIDRHENLPMAEAVLSEAVRRCEKLGRHPTDESPDSSDNPHFMLAAALSNLCLVYSHQQKFEQAQQAAERSIQIREELLRESPESELLQRSLASVHVNLGGNWYNQKRWDLSLTHNRTARDLYQRLADNHPDVLRHRYLLSSMAFNIAQAQRNSGQLVESLVEFQIAVESMRQLVQLNPGSITYREQLAGAAKEWGKVLLEIGKKTEAEAPFRTAVESFRAIVDREPDHRNALAYCAMRLADAVAATKGGEKEAEQLYRESVKYYRLLGGDEGKDLVKAVNLSSVHIDLGRLYIDQDRDDEAEAQFRASLDVVEAGLAAAPDDLQLIEIFINVNDRMGRQLFFGPRKDTQQALRYWQSAFDRYGDGQERWPDEISLHLSLVELRRLVGEIRGGRNEFALAVDQYERQLPILNALLARDDTNHIDLRRRLLLSLTQQGFGRQQMKLFERAEKAYLAADETAQELIASDPKDNQTREKRARIWFSLGTVYEALDNMEKAKAAYTTCRDLFGGLAKDFPDNETYEAGVKALTKKVNGFEMQREKEQENTPNESTMPSRSDASDAQSACVASANMLIRYGRQAPSAEHKRCRRKSTQPLSHPDFCSTVTL